VYTAQDYEGKAAILKVILKSVTLRGEEADFVWHEPFDIMFSIGELVISRKRWGNILSVVRTLVSSIQCIDISPSLEILEDVFV
jgi:hypothetical protein